jgi:hypothetical protein
MLNLQTTKPSELTFKLNVEGSKSTPESRLVLKIDDNSEIAFKGNVNEDLATVNIPPLNQFEDILGTKKTINGYFEVIVENNYFTPWKGGFTIVRPLKVSAESVGEDSSAESLEEVKNPSVSVSVSTATEPVDSVQKEAEEQVTESESVPSPNTEETPAEKVVEKADKDENDGNEEIQEEVPEINDADEDDPDDEDDEEMEESVSEPEEDDSPLDLKDFYKRGSSAADFIEQYLQRRKDQ